jgi:hypothetical protein
MAALCTELSAAASEPAVGVPSDDVLFTKAEWTAINLQGAAAVASERALRIEKHVALKQKESSLDRGLTSDQEYDQFVACVNCRLLDDVVDWWLVEDRYLKWPRIFRVFLFTSGAQATSAESERAFSTAG